MNRMKLIFAVVLCAPGWLSCTAQPREEQMASLSTERWVSLCEPIANAAMDAKGNLSVSNSFQDGECFGAFEAINVLMGLRNSGKAVLGICPPQTTFMAQQIRIFLAYAKRRLERAAEPFAYVAVAALSEAFPCRSK